MLEQMDINGQEALLSASVLIIGMGGLGSPVAMYLAAAGVGHLLLADMDVVDLTNLQRQIVHRNDSIGMSKVESAAMMLSSLNPETRITRLEEKLCGDSLLAAVRSSDLVLDCTDNFQTRLEINKACVSLKKPLVSGAAIRMEGQVGVFDTTDSESPCYQCLYKAGNEDDFSCARNGVMAPVVGIIGTIQAMEAIKMIANVGKSLKNRMLFLDAGTMQFREMQLKRDPECPVCSNR